MLQFLTATLVCLSLAAALSSTETELPGVTVYGTATTKVAPDLMEWRLVAHNQGSKLASVAELHTKLVQQVLGFLKEHGIKESDLQTSQMEFGENWEYRSQSRVKEGYFASTQISFCAMDLSSYKPLWLGLAEMSGITVEGVTYDHSKRIAYQNETRRKAVLAAKEKAADLAAALGSEIAEPVRIEEDLTINDACRAASSLSNSNRVDGGSGGAEQESLAPRNDSYPHPGEAHVSPRNARRVRIWLETTARFKATGWIPSGGSGSISLNALWFATWRGREQRQRWETGHPPNADQRRWAQFLRAFQRLEYRDRIEVHRFPFARARIIT